MSPDVIPPARLRREAIQASCRLKRSDRPLAVTLVEQYHRPFARRAAEYIYWVWLTITASPKSCRITLGRSQVRASVLLEYLSRQGREATVFYVVAAGEQLLDAVELAALVLADCPLTEPPSRIYTGLANPYYDGLVAELVRIMTEASSQRPAVVA